MQPNTPISDSTIQAIAARFAEQPQVAAVAVAGSRTVQASDALSDVDLYVYAQPDIPIEVRAAVARDFAREKRTHIEINNQFWETGDEWYERESGVKIDIMHRWPQWANEQLDRVLVHHQASVGYSTSIWYNILNSQPVFDRDGWFARLKQQADQPYPEPLRRAIIAKNYPLLRDAHSAYSHQLEAAIARHDRISVNHRIAGLLASYFDILFAVNRVPNPGEKRLIEMAERWCPARPAHMATQINDLLFSIVSPWDEQTTRRTVNALVDGLDGVLSAEGLKP